MQGLEPYRNSVNIFWLNKYGLIVYLLVVLSQCSMGSLLPCADLDCHATSGGVSICVCVYIMCWSFILTSSLFLSKSFPFLPPHPQLSLFCLLQRINSGSNLSCWSPWDTYPLFLYCLKKKKKNLCYLLFILFTYFVNGKSTTGPLSVIWYLCCCVAHCHH